MAGTALTGRQLTKTLDAVPVHCGVWFFGARVAVASIAHCDHTMAKRFGQDSHALNAAVREPIRVKLDAAAALGRSAAAEERVIAVSERVD